MIQLVQYVIYQDFSFYLNIRSSDDYDFQEGQTEKANHGASEYVGMNRSSHVCIACQFLSCAKQ